MKRILVTGAAGFIGTHLVRRLLSEDTEQQIVGIRRSGKLNPSIKKDRFCVYQEWYCDLDNYNSVKPIMDWFKPDVVYHLASKPLIKKDTTNPCGVTIDNVLSTHHLLECCPPQVDFIFTSSAAVYGDKRGYQWNKYEPLTCSPNSPYGASKLACETYIQAYARLKKVKPFIFRLVANVGSHATHGLLLDVVRKLLSPEEKLHLFGERPGSVKPFCHVSDTVEALANYKLFEGPEPAAYFNLSPEDEMSVEEVAEEAMEAIGIHKEINWLGKSSLWEGDNKFVEVFSNKSLDAGWKPKYPTSKEAVRQAAVELAANLTNKGAK